MCGFKKLEVLELMKNKLKNYFQWFLYEHSSSCLLEAYYFALYLRHDTYDTYVLSRPLVPSLVKNIRASSSRATGR